MSAELINVDKAYGEHIIFHHLHFNFSSPGFYLISGKSGSGKTTLLNMIMGYEPIDSGTRNLSQYKICCIFQNYELIDTLTVRKNVQMSLDLQQLPFDDTIFKRLGLKAIEDQYPAELSGGQKQRVGFARALYQNPDILLCDEPTEALDINNKAIVLALLKELSQKKIVIVCSHDIQSVSQYADYHYTIDKQQCILQSQIRFSQPLIVSSSPPKKIDQKVLRRIIYQIIQRRTKWAVCLFTLLLMTQLWLFNIDQRIFSNATTMNALNSHIIYINMYDQDLELLEKYPAEIKPILSFQPVMIEQKRCLVNVYPLEQDKDLIQGYECLINQQTLALFKNETATSIIGKEITLSYKLLGQTDEMSFYVKQVIEEKDTNYAQIYYPEDTLIEHLKKQKGLTKDETRYENFYANSQNYEMLCDPDMVEKIYQGLLAYPEISCSNAVLDLRQQNKDQMLLYHFLFMFLEAIALGINSFAILYFNWKDSQKNKTALSILHSINISLTHIKVIYTGEKILLMGSGMFIATATGLLLGLSPSNMLSYAAFILGIYTLSLGYHMLRLQPKQIADILKDAKDE